LCKGFKLVANGQNTKRILRTLNEMDKLYVENSIRDLPKFKPENQEVIVRDVLRILGEEEPASGFGFRAMLDKAIKPTPESTSKPISRGFRDGFIGMLEEASRGSEPESIIRSFGTNEEVRHRQWGFKAMLEAASGETPTITRKPIRRGIPFGFRAMLDHFSRKYEEEAENAKAVIRNCGFRGMLDQICKEDKREPNTTTFKSILQSAFPRITKPKPIVRSNLGFRGMLDDLSKAYEG